MISDSVIFVRNPACNNYHGTSSGVSPSSPSNLDPIQVSLVHHKSEIVNNICTLCN